MNIYKAHKCDYPTLIAIWEASVRATHDFLPEHMIQSLKPLILQHYFDAVELHYATWDDEITGFIGVAENNIEMLFVSPAWFNRGIGREMFKFAHHHLNACSVDVNEQNPGAIRFYEKLGFKPTGRSELDGQGNPFPLIHMHIKA